MVVAFVVMILVVVFAVFANAGVFLVVARRAFAEVEVELFSNGFGTRTCLDVKDNWKVVSFGQRFIGDESVSRFRKAQSSRIRTVSPDNADYLFGRSDDVPFLVEESDFHFSAVVDVELEVRFY